MLSVSIGTWAAAVSFGTNSTYEIDGTSITIHVGTAGDYATWINGLSDVTTPTITTVQACTKVTFTGTLNNDDFGKLGKITSNCTYDLTGITIEEGSEFNATNVSFLPADTKTFTVLLPTTIPVTNNFLNNSYSGITAINVSGTNADIYIRNAQFSAEKLATCPAGIKSVVIYSGGSSYSGNYGQEGMALIEDADFKKLKPENFGISSGTVQSIDLSHVRSWDQSNFTNNFSASGWKYVLDPVGKLSVSGTITADNITYMRNAFNCSLIDFGNATFSPDINILSVNSSVEGIVLPKGTEVTDALKAKLQSACPNLYYIYSPTNDSGASDPDYVYVVKSGGLKKAFENEVALRSGVYLKVGSFVALNADDVNFNALSTYPSKAPTAYEYLDFSEANLPKSVVANYTKTTSKDYRIIFPDGWSAEDLAEVVSANINLNNSTQLAAVYSYTGKNLKILEISDDAYSSAALSNTRIVRSDTEEINFVSASIDNATYGKFGYNALQAVNNAQSSIKIVKVLTNDIAQHNSAAFTDFIFTNDNITTLNVTGLTNNAAVVLNADGCDNLEVLNINGVHIHSVSANITPAKGETMSSLKTVNINDVDIDGDLSFQKSQMVSFVVGGTSTIDGNINLSYTDNLTYVDVVGVTFANLGSTDIILTRKNGDTDESDASNAVYSNLWTSETSNVKVSNAFVSGNGVIVPTLTPDAHEPFSTSTAGAKQVGCYWTINLDGSTTNYNTLSAALTYHSITEVCNLTINTLNGYKLTDDDITAINGLTFDATTESDVTMYRDATLNLDGAELDGNNLVKELSNSYIKNVILPRGLDKNVVNATFLAGLTNADFNGAISTNAEHTALVGYVKKPGQLRTIMSQVPAFRPNFYQYTVTNLRNITLGGTLIAADIATGSVNLAANGNYEEGANSDCYTALNNANSLKTLDISNAIFVDATSTSTIKPENMTLSGLGWGGITYLLMPTDERMNTVPANFLRNCQQIPYLCIPYNYQYINNEAFYLSGMNHITTTDSKGAEIDNGDDTYTFSKNLLRIGEALDTKTATSTVNGSYDYPIGRATPVFGSVTSGLVHDVYILRNGYEAEDDSFTPTICYRGCFASGMTYGWGGFDGGNVYCREKYKNGSTLYTVLHYPDQASLPEGYNSDEQYAAMEKAYTDVTKVYTKKDQTGAVDANGDPLPWPTFSELGRSYNQAIRGLVWGDWSELEEHKTKGGEVNGGSISFDASTNPNDVEHVENSTGDGAHWDFTDYVGWHEFVLSKATYVAPDENIVKNNVVYREYEADHWYTFCIPFDMTRKQVIDLLGVPASDDKLKTTTGTFTVNETTGEVSGEENTTALLPNIRTLKQVERTPGTKGIVNLMMSKDLSSTGEYWNINLETPDNSAYTANDAKEATADDKILIRGGYPYIIKPYKVKGTSINNLGQSVLMRYAFPLAQSSIEREDCYESCGGNKTGEMSKFAKPYEGHKIQAFNSTSGYLKHGTTDDKYFYTFIGQYWKQPIPQYSFYMYEGTWYHFTLSGAAADGYYWFPYRCVIMVTAKNSEGNFRDLTTTGDYATVIPEEVGVDDKGHAVFNQTLQITFMNGLDDSFTSTTDANAREYNFLFDDYGIMDFNGNMETTAIDRLDNEVIIPANSKIYNMNGQLVGKSLNGLSKGMYIVNGKKIVIK